MSYIYALTDTWNSAPTTFVGIGLNVTDTASAAASLLMDLQVGGSSRFSVRKDGVVQTLNVYATGSLGYALFNDNGLSLNSSARIGFTATGSAQNAQDLQLHRDAADTLAQRRGTNAQALRVYNTYTDASNYERAIFDWTTNANTLTIGTGNAGTGATRNLRLQPSSGTIQIPAGSYIVFLSGTGAVNWAGRVTLKASADGVFLLQNTGETDFNRLQFGGTAASFPSLKRNATALETKLADDSAYAPHAMQYLDVTDGVTAPAAATGRARIYVDTADGDLKIIFADGTIKTIVVDT